MKRIIVLCVVIFFIKSAKGQNNGTDSIDVNYKRPVADSTKAQKTDTIAYATLYFYRSYIKPMNAPIKKVPILINDTVVHNLKANTIISLKVFKEGKYMIGTDTKGENTMAVKIKFGKEYFFKCEIEKGLWFGKPSMVLVTPAMGRADSGILKGE